MGIPCREQKTCKRMKRLFEESVIKPTRAAAVSVSVSAAVVGLSDSFSGNHKMHFPARLGDPHDLLLYIGV